MELKATIYTNQERKNLVIYTQKYYINAESYLSSEDQILFLLRDQWKKIIKDSGIENYQDKKFIIIIEDGSGFEIQYTISGGEICSASEIIAKDINKEIETKDTDIMYELKAEIRGTDKVLIITEYFYDYDYILYDYRTKLDSFLTKVKGETGLNDQLTLLIKEGNKVIYKTEYKGKRFILADFIHDDSIKFIYDTIYRNNLKEETEDRYYTDDEQRAVADDEDNYEEIFKFRDTIEKTIPFLFDERVEIHEKPERDIYVKKVEKVAEIDGIKYYLIEDFEGKEYIKAKNKKGGIKTYLVDRSNTRHYIIGRGGNATLIGTTKDDVVWYITRIKEDGIYTDIKLFNYMMEAFNYLKSKG